MPLECCPPKGQRPCPNGVSMWGSARTRSEQSPVLSVLADRHIPRPFVEACRRTVASCLLLTCGLAVLRTVYPDGLISPGSHNKGVTSCRRCYCEPGKTLASFDPRLQQRTPYHPHSLLAAHPHRLLQAGCFYNKPNLSDKAALMRKGGRLLLARPAGVLYTVSSCTTTRSFGWVLDPKRRCGAV